MNKKYSEIDFFLKRAEKLSFKTVFRNTGTSYILLRREILQFMVVYIPFNRNEIVEALS